MKEQVMAWAKQTGASRYTNRHYPDRPTHTFTVEQLELYTKQVRNAALEQARQAAEDCDVVEAKGNTYYAQLGDAAATQRAIVAAIESLKEPTP